MRLDPAEVHRLPLAACLVDTSGRPVAATPEWPGSCPGTLTYHTGHGFLLVAPEAGAPDLDVAMARLLQELGSAVAASRGAVASRIEVVTAGLELVAGRPLEHPGAAARVIDLALASIPARTQGLRVSVAGAVPDIRVPAPAAIALALVQLAVNAHQHERAREVWLRVAPGPTFYVEWPGGNGTAGRVTSHRHALRRRRWGWGYVQMVADALGGSALPPGPTVPGREGASLGLGSARLTLPLACVAGGRVLKSTLAWDQDPQAPGFGRMIAEPLVRLVMEAEADPGRIVYLDLYRARAQGGLTWIALAPESGSARARDLMRGLTHEKDLWSAPEPHATRIQALAVLLAATLGDPLPAVPPSVWAEGLPAACSALGVDLPEPPAVLVLPEPRLAALLLAEAGGALVPRADQLWLAPAMPSHPLLAGLARDAGGLVRLSG